MTIKKVSKKNRTLKKSNQNNLKNFASIVNKATKLDNIEETLIYIYGFIQNNMIVKEYPELKKNTKFFGADKLGKSGGQVGILNNNLILKYYNLDESIKYKVDTRDKCIRVYFPFNELIINTVFSNMKIFLSKNKYQVYKKKYSNYLIQIKNVGIYKNNSFMISEKVGIKKQDKFYTNLYDVFKDNYIPFLLENIDNQKVLDEFCKFLCKMFRDYFECFKFLNKNLGYINTDMKFKNVFIKLDKDKDRNKNVLLKDLITDFTPLISDLDKATIKINDILVMPRPDKYVENLLVSYKHTRVSKVYEFRYNCFRNDKLCDRFESYQYDIILLFYDLYIILYQNIYFKIKNRVTLEQYYQKFYILNSFVIKTLNLNKDEFKVFYKRINESLILKLISKFDLGLHINAMIYNLCKELNKH